MGSRCLLLMLVLLAAACSRTTLKGTVAAAHAGDELDFWDGLSEARAVTNHDAMHALLLAFTDKAPAGFAAHLGEAKRRHWVLNSVLLNVEVHQIPEREGLPIGLLL